MNAIRIRAKGIELDVLDAAVDESGVEFESSYENAIDPISAVIMIGGALALGKFAMRVWNEYRGGVVLDLSLQPVEIRRSRDVPYGTFLTIARDGSNVGIELADEPTDSIERIVTAVLGGELGNTATEIQSVVDSLLSREKPA